jgi:integrase/recombinase XerD
MQHLTLDEIKKLVAEMPNERHRLMVLVGLFHGLRVSELINLTKEDIQDGYVSVQRLKGSLKTIQPYVRHPDPILNEAEGLTKLFGTLKRKERLFPMTRDGVAKLIQRAGARAGLPRHKLHPHALKHSCAMLTIKRAGIEHLRQYLGHKSIKSTGAYLRVNDEEASAAIAMSFGT